MEPTSPRECSVYHRRRPLGPELCGRSQRKAATVEIGQDGWIQERLPPLLYRQVVVLVWLYTHGLGWYKLTITCAQQNFGPLIYFCGPPDTSIGAPSRPGVPNTVVASIPRFCWLAHSFS